jgi:hypothetical protein
MRTTVVVVAGLLVSSTAFAQQPSFVNAKVVSRSAQPDVPRAIAAIVKAQVEPAWIGYAVPVINNEMNGRNDGWSERCRLEQQRVDPTTNAPAPGPIRLEAAPTVMVLLRVQAGEIRRVRSFSGDCQVDAGGLQLYWMGDVNAAQSVDFLRALVTAVAVARDQSAETASARARLDRAPRRIAGRRHHYSGDRQRPGRRGQTAGCICAQSAPARPGYAAPHQAGPLTYEPGRPKASHVSARPIAGSSRIELLRRGITLGGAVFP